MQFPTRIPVGFLIGVCLTLAAAPVTYKLWRHFESPLESFYLGTYLKASVMPSKTLLSGRPLLHRFYIVTVNGHDATPATLPAAMAGLSGRFINVQPSVFAQWLRAAVYHGETPGDLIGFIPAYLKPEAEILNSQVLLVGTPGHNEKLAIPIRNVDAESNLRECFDFVADARTATNTPAVLLASDDEYEVVSRGVITQPVFVNRAERSHPDVKFLVEKAPEALQA